MTLSSLKSIHSFSILLSHSQSRFKTCAAKTLPYFAKTSSAMCFRLLLSLAPLFYLLFSNKASHLHINPQNGNSTFLNKHTHHDPSHYRHQYTYKIALQQQHIISAYSIIHFCVLLLYYRILPLIFANLLLPIQFTFIYRHGFLLLSNTFIRNFHPFSLPVFEDEFHRPPSKTLPIFPQPLTF